MPGPGQTEKWHQLVDRVNWPPSSFVGYLLDLVESVPKLDSHGSSSAIWSRFLVLGKTSLREEALEQRKGRLFQTVLWLGFIFRMFILSGCPVFTVVCFLFVCVCSLFCLHLWFSIYDNQVAFYPLWVAVFNQRFSCSCLQPDGRWEWERTVFSLYRNDYRTVTGVSWCSFNVEQDGSLWPLREIALYELFKTMPYKRFLSWRKESFFPFYKF